MNRHFLYQVINLCNSAIYVILSLQVKPHILYWICSHDVFNFTSLTYFQISLSIAAPRQLQSLPETMGQIVKCLNTANVQFRPPCPLFNVAVIKK
jgi:hypothetical protein